MFSGDAEALHSGSWGMVQSLAVGHSGHQGGLFLGPIVLYFGSDRGVNQGGVCKCKSQRRSSRSLFSFPVGEFLNCFGDFGVLKSSASKQGCSA